MKLPRRGKERKNDIIKFAQELLEIDQTVGMPMSARGWGYYMEGEGVINKDQLDLVENLINTCRKSGLLPVDFTAQEEGRQFAGVEIPDTETVPEYMKGFLMAVQECQEYYTPDWWEGEEYYIQMLVEKIDLKNMFRPICEEYHIAIATAKGWSSVMQRAEYARRFKEATDMGLKCVLLYCGDHDPDGLRISQQIKKNLYDVKDVVWKDGTHGYNPDYLEIERFGLNHDFIQENNLVWIENLITGSGRNLAAPSHKNYNMPYVQNYLYEYGARKVEANAILKNRVAAQQMCRNAIEGWLGTDARDRFESKREGIRVKASEFRSVSGIDDAIIEAIELIDSNDGDQS